MFKKGDKFPRDIDATRVERYQLNKELFRGEHFEVSQIYRDVVRRINRVVGNFDEVISFPVLLNYHRLLSVKMADLVCGEYPTITGATEEQTARLNDLRDMDGVDFDDKLYATTIDVSRYGDAVWRIYLDEFGKRTFTVWDPVEWFPDIAEDGTKRILRHNLCWKENRGKDVFNPDYYLHVQTHSTQANEIGYYIYRVYKMDSMGSIIMNLVSEERVSTGLDICAVQHVRAFSTSDTAFGYDDYLQLDSILSEIFARIGQISVILDKHADPNITGPASMLSVDEETGEFYLKTGKFFATSPGESPPQYMVWEGQLNAAFKQLELLINQLYIISEMGAAILGGKDGSSQAISGTAMRFKLASPLAKARRLTNSLTLKIRRLLSALAGDIEVKDISVVWSDGLPNDPKELFELIKLATGAEAFMPISKALVEYLGKSVDEAKEWVAEIEKQSINTSGVNHPGPQDGTGVNPQQSTSETGMNNY